MNSRVGSPLISRFVVECSARRRTHLDRWAVDMAEVDSKIHALESSSSLDQASNNRLYSLRYRRDSLVRDVQSAQFCQEPRALFQSLINSIRKQMADYERVFPAGQSPHIQLCLYQIEVYLAFMETLPVESIDQQKNLYFALCGMLWSVLDRVDNPQDQSLAQSILLVFCEHRMQREDSLHEYNQFCSFYRDQLPDVAPSTVSFVLCRRFQEAKIALEVELKRDHYRHTCALEDVKHKAKDVMLEINTHKCGCDIYKKPFDFKLYTSVLSKTRQLAADPANEALKADYEYLMSQNKQGASSPRQMIVGAMLAFVGALTVAATFVAEAVSVCTSSAVSLPLKVAGFGTMIFGMTMFCAGKEYGTTAAMRDFRKEVDTCHREQVASSEEQRARNERLPLMVGMRRL